MILHQCATASVTVFQKQYSVNNFQQYFYPLQSYPCFFVLRNIILSYLLYTERFGSVITTIMHICKRITNVLDVDEIVWLSFSVHR